jgi:Tn7-like transposition protein D
MFLTQVFLGVLPVVEDPFTRFGTGPWRCPSPIARHSTEFPIKRITTGKTNSGEILASAKCSCGFGFYFKSVCANDSARPVVSRITNYGKEYRSAVSGLGTGLSFAEIAERLDLKVGTVPTLLRSAGKEEVKNNIHLWRQQWIKSRKRRDYQRLHRHDPEWVRSHRRKRSPVHQRASRTGLLAMRPDPLLSLRLSLRLRRKCQGAG